MNRALRRGTLLLVSLLPLACAALVGPEDVRYDNPAASDGGVTNPAQDAPSQADGSEPFDAIASGPDASSPSFCTGAEHRLCDDFERDSLPLPAWNLSVVPADAGRLSDAHSTSPTRSLFASFTTLPSGEAGVGAMHVSAMQNTPPSVTAGFRLWVDSLTGGVSTDTRIFDMSWEFMGSGGNPTYRDAEVYVTKEPDGLMVLRGGQFNGTSTTTFELYDGSGITRPRFATGKFVAIEVTANRSAPMQNDSLIVRLDGVAYKGTVPAPFPAQTPLGGALSVGPQAYKPGISASMYLDDVYADY